MYGDHYNAWRRRMIDYPLAMAFLVSLLVHLLAVAAVQLARAAGWRPARLDQTVKQTVEKQPPSVLVELTRPEEQIREKQPPMTFADVDPSTASKNAPQAAKHYAAISTRAANPNPKDLEKPKIDGRQDKIVRTFTAEQNVPKPVQLPEELKPLPKAEPQRMQPEQAPKPTLQPGKLATASPSLNPNPQARGKAEPLQPQPKAEQEQPRPRTIAEAKAQRGMIAGQMMIQDGGVKRPGKIALDAKGTPFGAYDAQIVAAIQKRWYDLIDQSKLTLNRSGYVVLEFRLHYDGTISGLNEVDSSVNSFMSLLCNSAISDPAPFPKWPTEMRLQMRNDYRDVRFTFYYN